MANTQELAKLSMEIYKGTVLDNPFTAFLIDRLTLQRTIKQNPT